jgi:hypothetical protein
MNRNTLRFGSKRVPCVLSPLALLSCRLDVADRLLPTSSPYRTKVALQLRGTELLLNGLDRRNRVGSEFVYVILSRDSGADRRVDVARRLNTLPRPASPGEGRDSRPTTGSWPRGDIHEVDVAFFRQNTSARYAGTVLVSCVSRLSIKGRV